MKRFIIIPTFNESQNIKSLLETLSALLPEAHMVVVDDSSPDGTGKIVQEYAKINPHVSLLSRKEKNGLGQAYLHAFKEMLTDLEISEIVMMDADFSHNPTYVPEMLEKLAECDVVIGSRYIRGGKTIGWETWRKVLSFFANLYCRLILRTPVRDSTSGFYALKAEKLRSLDFSSIDASGYAFQIEFKYLLWKHGARMQEFPIVFTNRVGGESKISGHIINEGILAPWKMLFR